MFAIVPDKFQMLHRIGVRISEATLLTVGINDTETTALITCREQCQYWHGSFSNCIVDSLEVYRGRQQILQIRPDEFSITDEGSIEVTVS